MGQQLDDARALAVVVLDDQQALGVRHQVALQPIQRPFQLVRRRRLGQVRERAVRQAVLPLFFDRQHLHRNVPRQRIQLQVRQHRPAQHVGQEDVQRDGRRPELARQRQRDLPALGDQPLEPLVARDAQQDPRVVRIVLDDQDGGVALPHLLAIVDDRLLGLGDREHLQRRQRPATEAACPLAAGTGAATARA